MSDLQDIGRCELLLVCV